MEILQVWLENNGVEPNEQMLQYSKDIISKLSPNDTFTLISNKNYLSDCQIVEWKDINIFISKMLLDKPNLNNLWNYLNTSEFQYTNKSDIIRLHYASRHSNVFYVDFGVEIINIPVLEDKVYFAQRNKYFVDYCVFWNGSNCDFFENHLNSIVEKLFDHNNNVYFLNPKTLLNFLMKCRHNFLLIEEQNFIHHRNII